MSSAEPHTSDQASLERENQRLQRAVHELSVLNTLAREITGSLDTQEIMRTIVHRSIRSVHAQQGVITLVDSSLTGPAKTLVRAMASTSSREFRLGEALLGWMFLNKCPLLVSDPGADERFRGIAWDPDIHNLLSVPLTVKSDMIGMLSVYNKKNDDRFDDGDERLLAIIAAQSAQVIENARLYEEEKKLSRMREQVHLAAEIQGHLLPSTVPTIPGYEVAGRSVAAQEIGGDYYDFIPLTEGRWSICIGDVSGKGLPASLLMANVQASMRLLAMWDTPPWTAMQFANRLLFQSTSPEKFVTFFSSTLDSVGHRLRFCNAGHNPPLLLSRSGSKQLRTKGIVLGMMPDFQYSEEVVKLEPGSIVVMFSDGVTEAINSHEEEFGEVRLTRIIDRERWRSAAEILDAVFDAVQSHVGKQPQYDDMTLVVLKRLAK